ncbi:oligosaccharide flippase family protein [Methylobacterium planeticum]|uniref:Oligosaccharide flippase family protein n=1 Tax=Methylobacterium planeticum TaxID=2615211 RepID=A0A6N6MLW1_9HYPH|nr:oligosaccharide flippase family protein [Methylobacterium planeticum]KAB1070767.1 oligosaccharide flippase family protein [Methylobacterium planeticum]
MIGKPTMTVAGLLHMWVVRSDTARALISGSMSGLILSAANRVITLVSTALLARCLGIEQFGIYSLVIAIALAIRTLVELGLPTLLVREVARVDQDTISTDQGAIIRDAVLLVMASSLLVAALIGLVLNVSALFGGEGEYASLLLLIILLPLGTLSRILAAALVGKRELFRAQLAEFFVAPVVMLGGAAFLSLHWAQPTSQNALAFQIAANALAVFCAAVWLKRGSQARAPHRSCSRSSMLTLGRAGLPFLIANIALLLNAQIDTVVVGVIGTSADVALYRIGAQSAIVSTFALQVIQNVASPYIAKFHADGNSIRVKQIFRIVQAITFVFNLVITILFSLAGGEILTLLFGKSYAAAQPILVIISTGYLLNAACGPIGMLLSMTGHEKALSRITWMTAIVNIAAAFVLGFYFGVIGISVATALSVAAYHLLMRFYARWYFDL